MRGWKIELQTSGTLGDSLLFCFCCLVPNCRLATRKGQSSESLSGKKTLDIASNPRKDRIL